MLQYLGRCTHVRRRLVGGGWLVGGICGPTRAPHAGIGMHLQLRDWELALAERAFPCRGASPCRRLCCRLCRCKCTPTCTISVATQAFQDPFSGSMAGYGREGFVRCSELAHPFLRNGRRRQTLRPMST